MRAVGTLALAVAAFLVVSVVAERNRAVLAALVAHGGAAGIIAFVLLTALFVVFVIPLDLVLLVPLGTAAWGPVMTAFMSIFGWTLGAAIAFSLARRFGAPLVGRIAGLARVHALEARIPRRHRFWGVVVLRLLVSVDVLSYALGLASDMPFAAYLSATALGVVPFGFYFAYAGALPFAYRALAVVAALALATAVVVRYGIAREP